MPQLPYLPLFELTRGETVESIHAGAIAVVDVHGRLVAWYGDPETITFLRSAAKPFQVLPFLENNGQSAYQLTPREIALMCASHSGTDDHLAVLKALQLKTQVTEADLLCGAHYPFYEPVAEAMRERKEQPTPNFHNCSGKHTGMVAYARLKNESTNDYILPDHPVQQEILQTFAEMCALPVESVATGIDGCSAPNFAVPLRNAAQAYARLCDPVNGGVQPIHREEACRMIVSAMIFNPDMVAGPNRFDTSLMEVCQGRILTKGGAEGYQAVGLMPGALGQDSPALGIAVKISDGDSRFKIRPAVVLEVLRQLGALSSTEMDILANYGPTFPVKNWRKIEVGEGHPCFQLNKNS
jgi:L-asparaginase II